MSEIPAEELQVDTPTIQKIIHAAENRWPHGFRSDTLKEIRVETLQIIRDEIIGRIKTVCMIPSDWNVEDGYVYYNIQDTSYWTNPLRDALNDDPITDDWSRNEVEDFASFCMYSVLQASGPTDDPQPTARYNSSTELRVCQ